MNSVNYIGFAKHYFKDMKLSIAINLLQEALSLNRYHNVYYNIDQTYSYEGVDPLYGPLNFNFSLNNDLHYETFLILEKIEQINKILEKFNIKTIQSQPSYYINNESLNSSLKAYFNLPFVEFIGSKESIKIFETIKSDIRFNNYYFDAYPEIKDSQEVIRFCIMRPYIDLMGNQIFGFNDSDFWDTIIEVLSEINITNYDLLPLDKTKKWYIIDNNYMIIEIEKSNFHPLYKTIPLSTLFVRYNDDYLEFLTK